MDKGVDGWMMEKNWNILLNQKKNDGKSIEGH
jgi:hypothetical protein